MSIVFPGVVAAHAALVGVESQSCVYLASKVKGLSMKDKEPKLALLRDARSAMERTAGKTLSYCGRSTLTKFSFGMVAALIDGTVLLRIGDGDKGEDERDIELTIEDAERFWKAVLQARLAAEDKLYKISGRADWKVLEVSEDRAKIEHASSMSMPVVARWYRKSKVGHGKRIARCARCEQTLMPGTEVFRPEKKEGWGDTQFKRTVLCLRCTVKPATGLSLVV